MAKTRMLEDLREMLIHELDALTKKGDISKDALELVSKLTESIKNVDKIMMQEESAGMSMNYSNNSYHNPYSYDGGQSNEYSRNYYNSMRRGSYDYSRDGSYDHNSYDNSYNQNMGMSNARQGRDADSDGRYSEDSNYSQKRDARGRYSRDNYSQGYSRHSAKDRVIEHLEKMLDDSQNQSEQIAIMRCIDELQN